MYTVSLKEIETIESLIEEIVNKLDGSLDPVYKDTLESIIITSGLTTISKARGVDTMKYKDDIYRVVTVDEKVVVVKSTEILSS